MVLLLELAGHLVFMNLKNPVLYYVKTILLCDYLSYFMRHVFLFILLRIDRSFVYFDLALSFQLVVCIVFISQLYYTNHGFAFIGVSVFALCDLLVIRVLVYTSYRTTVLGCCMFFMLHRLVNFIIICCRLFFLRRPGFHIFLVSCLHFLSVHDSLSKFSSFS